MPQIQIFNQQALEELKRDHQRLEMQINNLTWRLRAFMSELGDDAESKKLFCHFSTNAAFSTSDEFVAGDIELQFGPGDEHTNTAGLNFYNAREHTASTYIFLGDSGDRGIAVWSGNVDDDWYIINMECP